MRYSARAALAIKHVSQLQLDPSKFDFNNIFFLYLTVVLNVVVRTAQTPRSNMAHTCNPMIMTSDLIGDVF